MQDSSVKSNATRVDGSINERNSSTDTMGIIIKVSQKRMVAKKGIDHHLNIRETS